MNVCYLYFNYHQFMYKGVVNLSQDQLPDFIQTGKSLQIKGKLFYVLKCAQ